MKMNTIDWDKVQAGVEREQRRMVWRPYGLPSAGHPERSAFFEGSIAPPWEIPEKLIISAAITGAFITRAENPHQPIDVQEIHDEADACVAAGASAIHIHVRDDHGYNTLDSDRFEQVIRPLKDKHPTLAVDGCLVSALPGEWERMRVV